MSHIFYPLEEGFRKVRAGRADLARWWGLRGVEAALWGVWAAVVDAPDWLLAGALLFICVTVQPALVPPGASTRARLRWLLWGMGRWFVVGSLVLGPGVLFLALDVSDEARVRWGLALLLLNLLSLAAGVAAAAALSLRQMPHGSTPASGTPFRTLLVIQIVVVAMEAAVGATATGLTGTWSRAEVLDRPESALFVAEITAIGLWRLLGAPVAAWAGAARGAISSR